MRHDRLPGHGQVQQELTVVVVVRWMIRHPRPVTPDIEDLRGSGGPPESAGGKVMAGTQRAGCYLDLSCSPEIQLCV